MILAQVYVAFMACLLTALRPGSGGLPGIGLASCRPLPGVAVREFTLCPRNASYSKRVVLGFIPHSSVPGVL